MNWLDFFHPDNKRIILSKINQLEVLLSLYTMENFADSMALKKSLDDFDAEKPVTSFQKIAALDKLEGTKYSQFLHVVAEGEEELNRVLGAPAGKKELEVYYCLISELFLNCGRLRLALFCAKKIRESRDKLLEQDPRLVDVGAIEDLQRTICALELALAPAKSNNPTALNQYEATDFRSSLNQLADRFIKNNLENIKKLNYGYDKVFLVIATAETEWKGELFRLKIGRVDRNRILSMYETEGLLKSLNISQTLIDYVIRFYKNIPIDHRGIIAVITHVESGECICAPYSFVYSKNVTFSNIPESPKVIKEEQKSLKKRTGIILVRHVPIAESPNPLFWIVGIFVLKLATSGVSAYTFILTVFLASLLLIGLYLLILYWFYSYLKCPRKGDIVLEVSRTGVNFNYRGRAGYITDNKQIGKACNLREFGWIKWEDIDAVKVNKIGEVSWLVVEYKHNRFVSIAMEVGKNYVLSISKSELSEVLEDMSCGRIRGLS